MFIKDFSKISKSPSNPLGKTSPLSLMDPARKLLMSLRRDLFQHPLWYPLIGRTLPFEIMCDASDLGLGDVLCQKVDRQYGVIYYASKTLDNAEENYTTTALNKFMSYYLTGLRS